MKTNYFADATAHAIAEDCAAESALDAEAEAALRQMIRFRENGETGIGAALAMTIDCVEIRLTNESQRRRIGLPGTIRA